MNGSGLLEREDQDVVLGEFDDLRKLREVVGSADYTHLSLDFIYRVAANL